MIVTRLHLTARTFLHFAAKNRGRRENGIEVRPTHPHHCAAPVRSKIMRSRGRRAANQSCMKAKFLISGIMPILAAVTLSTAAYARPPHGGIIIGPFPGPGPGAPFPPPPPGPPVEVFIGPGPVYHHYRYSTDYYSDSTVARVQRALRARGYYAGRVDGDAGPGTRAAIVAFRLDHGLGSSSRITPALLRALGV